jgi:hypothetical protein
MLISCFFGFFFFGGTQLEAHLLNFLILMVTCGYVIEGPCLYEIHINLLSHDPGRKKACCIILIFILLDLYL